MKHQQVVVNYWDMFKTSAMCLMLAFSGYIFLKMVQTIFWLPNHLKKNQERLEAMATEYGKDMDPDERAELEKIFNSEEPLTQEKLAQLLETSKDESKCSKNSKEEHKLLEENSEDESKLSENSKEEHKLLKKSKEEAKILNNSKEEPKKEQ